MSNGCWSQDLLCDRTAPRYVESPQEFAEALLLEDHLEDGMSESNFDAQYGRSKHSGESSMLFSSQEAGVMILVQLTGVIDGLSGAGPKCLVFFL